MNAHQTISNAPHPWDNAAEGWNRHSAIIDAWLHDVTEAMITAAGVGPGSRVLDVAAGAGGQTLAIAPRVGSSGYVLATDISPRILDLAREKRGPPAWARCRRRSRMRRPWAWPVRTSTRRCAAWA